jgi:hypothetical protein
LASGEITVSFQGMRRANTSVVAEEQEVVKPKVHSYKIKGVESKNDKKIDTDKLHRIEARIAEDLERYIYT